MSRAKKWTAERQAELKRRWHANERVATIAEHFATSPGAIYVQVAKLGLPARRMKRGRAAAAPRTTDRTGQRRFSGVVSTGPKIILADHHPAVRKGTPFFPGMVKPAAAMDLLLKSGEHSRKLGAKVEKGRWKDFPIVSLTLEERDTCPRSCAEWATCYGNNMPFATRILDDGTLTRRLWGELASLNARHPRGYLVRLHVLGDFYSVDYVEFWRQALIDFPALHVFGFTARQAPDPIGIALMQLVGEQLDRFAIRFSGGWLSPTAAEAIDPSDRWAGAMCAEVVDTPDQANGIVCPAESDPDRCCANCALCFNSIHNITFIRH